MRFGFANELALARSDLRGNQKTSMKIYATGVTPNVLIGGSSQCFVWISAEGRIRPKPCGGPAKSMRE
jgi:hypothetical protein